MNQAEQTSNFEIRRADGVSSLDPCARNGNVHARERVNSAARVATAVLSVCAPRLCQDHPPPSPLPSPATRLLPRRKTYNVVCILHTFLLRYTDPPYTAHVASNNSSRDAFPFDEIHLCNVSESSAGKRSIFTVQLVRMWCNSADHEITAKC